jgi:cellulose synthase/poly-beta-1,6-N-acetylglucosamine synthase-like glycosyltransferase
VEDLALMNAVTRTAGQKLGWAAGPSGVADSTPEDKFSVFIEQRRRWLNEAGDMSTIGKLMIGFELFMAVSLVSSILIAHRNPVPLICTVSAWLAGNIVVIAANPGSTFRDVVMIPLFYFFQLFYSIVIGFRNLFGSGKIVWKGREYF